MIDQRFIPMRLLMRYQLGEKKVGSAASAPRPTEVFAKVLDGRALNGKFWFFYAALSSVDYTLTVTDTQTGAVRTYHNPPGQLASAGDTSAL